MKKLICVTLVLILEITAIAIFPACKEQKNGDLTIVKLNEVTHSVFYAPLYVAINLGYFEEEGIAIELTNGGGSDKTMTAIISDSADIGLLGPETALYVKAGGSKNTPKVFGQLTQKDGSFIIGRTKNDSFNWQSLCGSEIIGGRPGGMPAMCLEYAIKKNIGLWDSLSINYDIQFDLITAAFENGTGDYCTMFEPNASEYERLGKGYIMTSVGAEAGNMPYTAFMAKESYLAGSRELVKAFMRAIMKGIDYVIYSDAQDVATALGKSFPTTDIAILAKAVRSYLGIEAWKSSPVMQREDFENLVSLLEQCGTLSERVEFDDIIDNSIALELI